MARTGSDAATEAVAAYIAQAAERPLPEAVRERARLHALDTLAAVVSGSRLRAGRLAAAFVEAQGGRPAACLPGTRLAAPPVDAAFANGMAAHADETDDSHLAGRFHPGCAVLPAALAVAEARGAGLDAVLRAVALGYDVGARATLALGFSAPRSGTHSTHCLGANFGAAAAAAALAGLDAARAEAALSWAAQQASGIPYWQRDPEHVEKAFCFAGMGARNGVFAALFVASGAGGCRGALAGGDFNYLTAFAERPQPEALSDGLGERFEILRASIKKWCVGSPIQAALDSLTWLMEREGVTAERVARLRAIMPDDRLPIVDDRDMPDVCLQHLLALTLVDGGLSFATSHDHDRMRDPAVLEMRGRVEAVPSRELTEARPARQAVVEIELTDGRVVSRRTRAVLGTPDNPMNAEQVEAKALDLMAPVLGEGKARALVEAMRAPERVRDVRDLRPLLQP